MMTEPTANTAHWVRSPITTRHAQMTLLLVSVFWGLSYCMPWDGRIPFSEVFPPDLYRWSLLPTPAYGGMMLGGALVALIGERLIINANGSTRFGWFCSFIAHTVLCAVYSTLALAALVTGLIQAAQQGWALPAAISAMSRPVLWSYIGWLHLTYARLPQPELAKKPRRGRHVVEVDEEGGA